MTNRQVNVKVAKQFLLLFLWLAIPTTIMSLWDEEWLGHWLSVFGQSVSAHPLPWIYGLAGGAVTALALAYFSYDRHRKPRMLTKRDWDKFYLDRATSEDCAFEKNRHRMLDAPGLRDSMLKQSQLEEHELAELDQREQARKKRVSEMLRWRMIDLPGYRQWAARYSKLDEIIPNLETYAFLVHPDELARPLEAKFANEFAGWLNEAAERGMPHRTLEDYRKRSVL